MNLIVKYILSKHIVNIRKISIETKCRAGVWASNLGMAW